MNEDIKYEINGLKIDPKIFTFKFNCRCSGECCLYGVYMDLKESEKILNIKNRLIPMFDASQVKDINKWFEAPEADDDFESGIAIGTEINNHKCTFLDKNGLCSLQKLALSENAHKWKYKPLFCILFPLTIFEGTLTIDDEHIDRLVTCNKNPVPETSIYEACREELQHFLGEEGLKKLEKIKQHYLSELKAKDVA